MMEVELDLIKMMISQGFIVNISHMSCVLKVHLASFLVVGSKGPCIRDDHVHPQVQDGRLG